jgi:NitT/TauT family transport system ATP-binding protein
MATQLSMVSRTAPDPQATPKLRIHQASVTFKNRGTDFTACDKICFDVQEGEFVVIVGPSGSGKSTFLMALDGLVPLSHGEISIDGKVVTKPGQERAVVFQDASLLPWRTIIDNVAYGLEIGGMGKVARRDRARELIELAGLKGFENFFPSQLSGGMRQRVNIARALAADPQVLLLDEPFSGLDAQTREVMQAELLKIWGQSKKTAIFVTHQIDEAVYLADRVIAFSARPARVVQEWRIPFDRPRSLDIKHSPEHRRMEDEIWQVLRQQKAAAQVE